VGRRLSGLSVSPGVAIGKAVAVRYDIAVPDYHIAETDVRLELLKFDAALALSRAQLMSIRNRDSSVDGEIQKILDSQLLILVDPLFVGEVISKVKTEHRNIEKVVYDVMTDFSMTFESMKNAYLRERASDIRDIGGRILRNLLGEEPPPLHLLEKDTILVCDHLNASEVAHLDPDRVIGLVSEVGGETSHPAILARSLGIPAIVGVIDATRIVEAGTTVIVDCAGGEVVLDPSEEEIEEYTVLRSELVDSWERLLERSDRDALSSDGVPLTFLANISTAVEAEQVLRYGAVGVGLFRTEYLFMNKSSFPDEEEQYECYRKVAAAVHPGPATFRTLDIGGDKELPYLCFLREANPFLGWRSIRFSLDNPEIFKVQLRALLRASVQGNVRLMFPMISNVSDLERAKEILDEVRHEMDEQGQAYDENLEVGVMIEVPSAALVADQLAKRVDFFSIGTNDLTQFTLAVDRTNPKLSVRFEPLEPAVLRLIQMIVKAAHKQGLSISCCGEMTASPIGLFALLGLGIRDLSSNLFVVPQMKELVGAIDVSELTELAQKALDCTTASEVRNVYADCVERLGRPLQELPLVSSILGGRG